MNARNTSDVATLLSDTYLKTSGWGTHENRIKGENKGKPQPIKYKFLGLDCELSLIYPDYTERPKKSRLYVSVADESILDNLNNRLNRPVAIWKEIARVGLETMGLDPETYGRISWSQRAGCSCPCSPGFILSGLARWDIDIKVKAPKGEIDQITKHDLNAPARI